MTADGIYGENMDIVASMIEREFELPERFRGFAQEGEFVSSYFGQGMLIIGNYFLF